MPKPLPPSSPTASKPARPHPTQRIRSRGGAVPQRIQRHTGRFDRIYQAFLDAGVPLAGLAEGTKNPCHRTAPRSLLRDLYQIEAAMDARLNIGAFTHLKDLPGINPHGFWDLDIDGPDHGQDLSQFTYRVRRTGETVKAHYLARLPDPTVPLVTSYKGKDYDLCTWNTVMPGSIHKTGTLYELEFLEDGEWRPWDGEPFSVAMLPVVDPEAYRVQPSQPVTMPAHAAQIVQKLQSPNRNKRLVKPAAWAHASGRSETRTKMARHYLCYYAWRSISGKNGHDALLVVVTNLRLFFRLDQSLALGMVKEHFNPRCQDLRGNPCPWSEAEIARKWNEAGKPDAYPTLGVASEKGRRKAARIVIEGEVAAFLAEFTQEGGKASPSMLRDAFIVARGGEDVSTTAFGRAVSKATGIQTSSPNGPRMYQGFHLTEVGLRLTRRAVEVA